jgi:hypothetical protein
MHAKRLVSWFLILAFFSILYAKVAIKNPESCVVTTKGGLELRLSNQFADFRNNDAVAYLVVSAVNKSRKTIKLKSSDFRLRDQAGKAVEQLSGERALKAVVDWNYEQAHDTINVAGADLRDLLRSGNRRYTEKELADITLKPLGETKDRLLFFTKLPKARYILQFGMEEITLRVEDGVYFEKLEGPASNKAKN